MNPNYNMAGKVMLAGALPEGFAEQLEDTCGVKTFLAERDLLSGHYEENIEDILSKNDGRIIFGVQENKDESRESGNHVSKFLSLSQSYDNGKCNIIPVKFSSSASVPNSLAHLQSLTYSGDKAFWTELLDRLKNPITLEQVLPVGNVSHGLIQNYLYGYLKRILTSYPELYRTWLQKRKEQGEDDIGYDKLIILLPTTCACKPLLNEYDKSVTCMKDDSVEKRMNRAGQEKLMVQAVYKIEHGAQPYMLMVEVPNIITTISKLVGRTGTAFTQNHVPQQFKVFRQYLQEALDFQEELRDRYLIIEFPEDDPNLKLGELIVQKIEEDKAAQAERLHRTIPEYDYDVNVLAENENDQDLQKAITYLEDNGLKVFVYQADRTMGSSVAEQRKEISKSRKTLLWIDSTIKQEEMKLAYFEEQDIQERQRLCKLIPVVKGSGHTLGDKYHYIQRSNHLCSDEPHFLEKLLQAAKGEAPLTYPLGDIASGMVWTYCLNYLEPNLKSYVDSYEKTLEYDKESVLFPYFICLVPKSCHAPGKITDYDNTIVRMTDDYKEEIMFKKVIAGVERKFNVPINKVHYNGKIYKVMCEFVTPLAALADMEKGMKTQLSLKHKLQQREQFDKLISQVIASGTQHDTPLKFCKLLHFDDDFEDQASRRGPMFNLSELIARLVEANSH